MANWKGGKKFEEAAKKMADALRSKAKLRVGFLENATYPDGTPVALIGAIQNFGAPKVGIPPRPFFSNVVKENRDKKWPTAMALLLKQNNYDVKKTLEMMGLGIRDQIQQSIRDTNTPPLKPRTIVAKGGTPDMKYDKKKPSTFPAKPLIRSGHMLNSVDYDIKEGD